MLILVLNMLDSGTLKHQVILITNFKGKLGLRPRVFAVPGTLSTRTRGGRATSKEYV